jgi:lactate racemase
LRISIKIKANKDNLVKGLPHMLLDYGYDQIDLALPPSTPWEVIKPAALEPLADPLQSIINALQNPINCPPLGQIVKANEKVCLLVNDSTRVARSELFLPPLIDTLIDAGIDKEDLSIVFTNGTHRPLTKAEMTELAGEYAAGLVAMYNHDSKDSAGLIYVGETSFKTSVYVNRMVMEADRRILTGSVVHHFFAGFGGGRKALIPGVAGWETIQKNHSLMLDDRACSGNLAGNPVHEDLLEAALMVGGDFIVNTVLNERKELLGVFAGAMIEAHAAACRLADQANGVKLNRLADVVIASCGGHPKDINLYQAHKALDNAMAALKPGGKLILLAKCPEGVGSDHYLKWASSYRTLPELEAALSKEFVLGGHKAYTIARLLQRGSVYLLSALPPEQSRMLGFTPIASLEEGIKLVYGANQDLFTYLIPQGSLSVPSYH